ncbi:MAG: hypothetical protein WCT10_04570 [Patescibacteria group bacterium]|jgi:hypothetical protein
MSKLSSLLAAALALVILTLLPACGGFVVPLGMPAGYCADDADCPNGNACVDDRCVASAAPECAVDSDCVASGQICNNGACVALSPEDGSCYENADCQPWLICLDGVCDEAQPAGQHCYANADCQPGLACEGGVCAAPPEPECLQDSGCAEGSTCRDEHCVELPPQTCDAQSDCGEHLVCKDGSCVRPGCRLDSECAAGKICYGWTCVQPPADCANDGECPEGRVCRTGDCVKAEPPADCSANSDCDEDEDCLNGQCVESGSDEACSADVGCPSGFYCSDDDVCTELPADCADDGKITLCHRTQETDSRDERRDGNHHGESHEITVGCGSLSAHLRHGDQVGNCLGAELDALGLLRETRKWNRADFWKDGLLTDAPNHLVGRNAWLNF